MATAEKDNRANIGDLRSRNEHQEVQVRLAKESVSRFVNGFMTAAGDPIMIIEHETFSVLAWLSWDVKSKLHYVGHVRWIRKQITPHHPFGWEVRVTVWLAGGSKDIVMGANTKGGGGGALPLDLWKPGCGKPNQRYDLWGKHRSEVGGVYPILPLAFNAQRVR